MSDAGTDWVSTFNEGGPQAVLDEVEEMIPESWREHIAGWPLTAMALGVTAGVILGMKKGDEVLSAASTMVTAAATAQLSSVFGVHDDEGE